MRQFWEIQGKYRIFDGRTLGSIRLIKHLGKNDSGIEKLLLKLNRSDIVYNVVWNPIALKLTNNIFNVGTLYNRPHYGLIRGLALWVA